MEKIRQCFLLLLFSQAFATLGCDELPGIWWGYMSDEMHLMLDESVPVVFKVEKKEDQYIGQFQFINDVPAISSRFWIATCDQGQIKNVYFIDSMHNQCGIQSKDIVLDHALEMTLNWQNAMIDTTLKVDLVRLKKKLIEKPNLAEHHPKTCH